MRRTLYAVGLLPALLLPLVLSGKELAADPALTVRCFYGRSNSYSSRETALNGELFVMMVREGGKKGTFKIVFHHRLKFYKTVVNADLGKEATELKGYFAIDGRKVPFRMDVKDGTVLGELGAGLDKGVITMEDFDKESDNKVFERTRKTAPLETSMVESCGGPL